MKVNVTTIALTLPIYGVQRALTVLEVEQALYRISAVTRQPIEAFYSDAIDWCSHRVSSYVTSLNYAYELAARGEKLPWENDSYR